MNTFLLFWNPTNSSYILERLERDFGFDGGGIIMSGTLTSAPYLVTDMSGNDGERHYVDTAFDVVIHPDSPKVLAAKLDSLWNEHIRPFLSLEKKALTIAMKAHAGQVDKAGEEYINHPLRVAKGFIGELRIVALLHDVVEDSDITLDQLREEGFSDAVISALDAVTKREGELYDEFIGRIKENPMAVQVKLADLKDNMDLSRLPELTERDLQRVVKYHKAYRFLQQYSMMQDGSCCMLID